jgi:hypothetical protein
VIVVGVGLLGWALAGKHRGPRASGAIRQQAYVWQRDWNSNVVQAVDARGPRFDRLVVLAAEIRWRKGEPDVTRVALPWEALAKGGRPVGVAVRVGAYSGPFSTSDDAANLLRDVVRDVRRETRSRGVEVAEIQIDFDCAERLLDGYRVWVEALGREVRPVPLVITTLPSWLKQPTFAPLVRATDGFVLQVHSLVRPSGPDDAVALCDPQLARRAVETASRVGVPFRVALPTYGYLLTFDANGRFVGASSEGPPASAPAGATYRTLTADPTSMADLVAAWVSDRPAGMVGILWYRMPVWGDQWNWRWDTLEAVMLGRVPRASVTARWVERGRGLYDLEVANEGSADRAGPFAVRVHPGNGSVQGCDAVRGFRVENHPDGELLFTNASCRLRSGDRAIIGWMRIEASSSVESFHLEIFPD